MIDQHPSLYTSFRWAVPTNFNIGHACCHRWANSSADARRIALFFESETGTRQVWTYERIATTANQLANGLTRMGVKPGDRIAVILGQRPETIVAHIAIYSVGAVVTPLSNLFKPEALEKRIKDAGAKVAIFDEVSSQNVLGTLSRCPALKQIIGIDVDDMRVIHWKSLLLRQPSTFKPYPTRSNDPALLLYPSVTSDAPKGVLLAHSALMGNLPGFVASQNWFPQPGDVFWSPVDWSCASGLMNALLPSLYFGRPIVGTTGKFTAAGAFDILERYRVTNTFLYTTAINQMMLAYSQPNACFKLNLRGIMTTGDSLKEAVFVWCQQAFGITPNEVFGLAEMHGVIGNSHRKWHARIGSMGKPYPGHQVTVIDETGQPTPPGQIGEIALNRFDIHGHPDPVLFLGYWNNEEATSAQFIGDWCRTGDLAKLDADGYYWFAGRAQDIFQASGDRIEPTEIENCLLQHPAVKQVAIVPKPDAEHGATVKAFIVLRISHHSLDLPKLTDELQKYVQSQFASCKYPKEIEYMDSLPIATNGKIQRSILRQLEIARANGTAKNTKKITFN